MALVEGVFKLPMAYLPNEQLHPISTSLVTEFELETNINESTSDKKPVYDYLFQPTHILGKDSIKLWKESFTSNPDFLRDQQTILRRIPEYNKQMDIYSSSSEYKITDKECNQIRTIWNSTQMDANFLETHSYMDISFFKFLNKIPAYLQTTSVLNMTSPILSMLIPIIMLIMPFLILKVQGLEINIDEYIKVLSQIAKRHFIGMAINVTKEMNATNMVYFVGMFVLYIYQMYTNYTSCIRFYSKMRELNDQLLQLKKYVEYSIESCRQFSLISKECLLFSSFNADLNIHLVKLQELKQLLSGIYHFEPSLSKITQIGYMQRCYYELYDNRELASSLQWTMGFEGYINNLLGVYSNLTNGYVSFAQYSNQDLFIKNQTYAPISDSESKPVKNDCDLERNILITGPNAAGKTTYLKTTLLNVLFSQQIGCGYYESCRLCPYQRIHTYLNIPDTSERDSLFQAESRRCKNILDSVVNYQKDRQLCVFDELYSGTNPEEATKSSFAFLKYLAKYKNVNFLLTTHYAKVCKKLRKNPRIKCCKMEAKMNSSGDLSYSYKIVPGISKIQGAYCVLKSMNYPKEILECFGVLPAASATLVA